AGGWWGGGDPWGGGRRGVVWAGRRRGRAVAPPPEGKKKGGAPPRARGPATTERGPGPGRDRPAAVPAVARRLVEARRGRPGLAERPQRAARDLRGDEPADRDAAPRTAPEGAQRRLPGVPRGGPVALPRLACGTVAR